ncbi:MAG TPA: hypothetical protein VNU97_04545 [Rhizomicrobium sp.]|jgi:hypothetical protein|nr:hypothetical protein [Rhizomicrobium sp.]
MRRTDIVHLGLLAAALALAYVLPFELLLLSYAVLGPAHYFTEISWLHDRSYFLPHRAFAVALAAVALGAMFIADPYWSGVLLWSVFAACAILAAAPTPQRAIAFGTVAVAVTAALVASNLPFALVGILLPTFIHVCVFTLVFMTLGAVRAKSGVQGALVGVYLAMIAAILIAPPTAQSVIPALARIGKENFGDVAPALGSLFGVPDLQFGGRITGLLSFVYTYHYLNWFLKADVIRWTQMPRPRLAAIVALSAASTALYFYNYEIGITVLLLVSLLHVLLEFPLNSVSLRQLAGAALGRRAKASAA